MEILSSLVERVGKESNEILDLRAQIDLLINQEKFEKARTICKDLIDKIKQTGDRLLLKEIVDLTYSIRGKYMRGREIRLGAYVNAQVEFIPKTTPTNNWGVRKGDPGFIILNELGEKYGCYIKRCPSLKLEDFARLLITNVNQRKNVIYLEPRVEVGDRFLAQVKEISDRGEPFFRFLSYDGFVKNSTKRLRKGNAYEMQATHSKLSVRQSNSNVFRVGILYANALRRVDGKLLKESSSMVFRDN